MIELNLTRSSGDRRRYLLAGVRTLRLEGPCPAPPPPRRRPAPGASAAAASGSGRWAATTPSGELAGTFAPRGFRRGGALRWGDHALTLQPISALRERYLLADGGRELARIDGRSWGRRRVTVTLAELAAIEPGLLLFACFVARQLADDSSSGSTTVMAAG